MAGRRRAGGLASAVDMMNKLMLNDIEQKKEQQRLAQEYAQRLKIKALEQEFERGSLGFNLETGQIEKRDVTTFDPAASGLVPDSYKDPVTGVTHKRPDQELMSQKDAGVFLNPARPGQPFPTTPQAVTQPMQSVTERTDANNNVIGSNIRTTQRYLGQGGGLPTTPEAFNTLQGAINAGRTESPAAQVVRPQLPPMAPQTPQAPQQGGGFRQQAMDTLKGVGVGSVFGPGGAMMGALPQVRSRVGNVAQGMLNSFQERGQQPDVETENILSDLQIGALSPEEFLANIELFAAEGVDVEFIRQAMGL